MAGSNTVEALWARALELSEDGSVHEAVLTFEQAAQLLEKQKDQAMRTKGAERVRQLLDELIAKLGREIESHLNYLRGNLWAALDLTPGAASSDVTRAYKRLALKYHPDKSRVSPKIFTIVGRAREVLGDADEAEILHTGARRGGLAPIPARARRRVSVVATPAPRRRRAGDMTGSAPTDHDRRRDDADAARRRRPSADAAKKGAAAAAKTRYGSQRDGPGAAAARAFATGTKEKAEPLSEDRVRRMNIGELKASLRRSGLPATGERRDLERDVLRAAGLRPKTPVPRHVVAAQLRAASPASRARRASQLPEDVLRDLLREEGVAVDGDLVQAAVDAFGDDKEDEDSFFDESDGPGADGPGVAFARPASPDSDDERRPDDRSERAVYEPASDNERRPRDPRFVRPHASSSSDSDDSGILPGAAPARGGFVGALRGRTSQHKFGGSRPDARGRRGARRPGRGRVLARRRRARADAACSRAAARGRVVLGGTGTTAIDATLARRCRMPRPGQVTATCRPRPPPRFSRSRTNWTLANKTTPMSTSANVEFSSAV